MSLEGRARRNQLRATAHPLRLQMLSLLTGAELSAAEVARELDITQANASYHLRFLLSAGLLVIAGEESVRGGRAKKYRHPWDADPADAAVTDSDMQAYVGVMADALLRRLRDRRTGATSHLTDAELWLEPDDWQRALDLVMEASVLVHGRAKPPRTEGTVRANLTVAAFQMVGPGSGQL